MFLLSLTSVIVFDVHRGHVGTTPFDTHGRAVGWNGQEGLKLLLCLNQSVINGSHSKRNGCGTRLEGQPEGGQGAAVVTAGLGRAVSDVNQYIKWNGESTLGCHGDVGTATLIDSVGGRVKVHGHTLQGSGQKQWIMLGMLQVPSPKY